jgi:uncharacterized phage-associated protein
MQLLKLVYVAHGYMLGRHGRPLLSEPVQAWQYGPVVPSVYHATKGFRSAPVSHVPGAQWGYPFTPEERAVMDSVVSTYAAASGPVLSAATHQPGTPWSHTWSLSGKSSTISNDLIEGFYNHLLRQPTHSAL